MTMAQPRDQKRKGGLGRGLAALIPTGPDEGPRLRQRRCRCDHRRRAPLRRTHRAEPGSGRGAPTAEAVDTGAFGAFYREISPLAIRPNPKQPRSVFDEDALAELVHSITEFGLMQPIVVRQLSAPHDGVEYELVMGERRWRASQKAGLTVIPAIVRETADDAMLRDALLENIHRVQLNPLEEAAAYQQLLEEFDVTHDELAAKLGRSRPVVTNTLRLLKLPVAVQRRVAAGVLSAGHARALLGLNSGAEAQAQLAGADRGRGVVGARR